MNEWELNVLFWIQENLTCPFLNRVLPVVTSWANHGEIWILLAVVLIAIPKTRKTGLAMGITLLMGLLVGNLLLKNLVARVRPYDLTEVTLLVSRLSDYSFPSGHTLASVGAATALMLYQRWWGIPALVLAAVIAFSRLYLFVHFPTDVVAGALLGVALAFFARWLLEKWYQKKNPAN